MDNTVAEQAVVYAEADVNRKQIQFDYALFSR